MPNEASGECEPFVVRASTVQQYNDQEQLAEWLQKTRSFVSKYERGQRRLHIIEQLAQALR